MGGTRTRRLAVVREFHRASPLADEPFVAIDCEKDELRLCHALEQWLLSSRTASDVDSELGGRVGVLYLESIAALSTTSQRLLLMLAHRLQALESDARPAGPWRLMAGDRTHLVQAARSGRLSSVLVDHLDKIRVELGLRRSRGVA
jgi:hypothetical protein